MTRAAPVAPVPSRRLPVSGPLLLAGLGAAAFLVGLALEAPRAWAAFLVVAFGLLTLALGGAVLVALVHVTGGRWADRILEVPQSLALTLPWVGAPLVLLAAGYGHLYPWADAARVHADPVLEDRAAWMSVAFVALRALLFLTLWSWAARRLVRRSREAVAQGTAEARRAAGAASARWLLLFGPTFSIACVDALMSLEPRWTSTLFALLQFAGLIEAAVAAVILAVLAGQRSGALPDDEEARHDLGKLLFAFAFFWGYLWFCQYMLIWYTNMPEEVEPYVVRHAGAWEPLSIASVALSFALPFALLLSRHAKRSATVLGRVALVVLVGRALELLLAVQPTVLGATPRVGAVELALLVGAGAWMAWAWARLRAAAPGAVPEPGFGRRWEDA